MLVFSRLIFSLVLAVALGSGCAKAQGFFDHPLIGKDAPDFILDTLKSRAVHFQDVSRGKKTVLFFWATWCPHCRDQMKELKKYEARLAKEGVTVVLVNIGEEEETVKSFMKSKNYDFDVFLDRRSYVAEMYDVFGVPTLFFIGENGKVREMLNFLPDDFERIFE